MLQRIKGLATFAIVKALSWPLLFGFFRTLQKVCLHAMNRTSAGFFPVTATGEQHALRAALEHARERHTFVVFDCGANMGEYSAMVVREARKRNLTPVVHAFEPASYGYESLMRNPPSANGEIVVHNVAVGATAGTRRIYFPWHGAGGASLSSGVSSLQGTARFGEHSEEVNVTTIDEFCVDHRIGHIDLLKLDIEGSEYDALLGARRTLEANCIGAIQFELGAAALEFGRQLYDFWKLLSDRFDFYLVLAHGLVRLREYKPDLECFYGGSNFLLVAKR